MSVVYLSGDEATLKRYFLKNTHDELLRRSLDLLVFVANRGQLQHEHIMLLWNAAGQPPPSGSAGAPMATSTQSSTTTRTVYKVLSQLSSRLSSEHLSVLLNLIQTIPRPIDEGKVELIRGVAEGVLGKVDAFDDTTIGIPVLWDTLMGGSACTDSITGPDLKLSRTQEAAAHALATLLSKPVLRSALRVHMGWCIDVIRGGPSGSNAGDVVENSSSVDAMQAVCAMQLLRKIVEMQPEASRGLSAKLALSRERIIGDCENDFKLLRAVMLCIGRSLSGASSVSLSPTLVASPTPAADSLGDSSAVSLQEDTTCGNASSDVRNPSPSAAVTGYKSSRERSRQLLHACMKFLEFILINSSLEIDFNALHTMWRQYQTYGSHDDMESGFFSWVQKACTDTSAQATTSAYANYYYNTRGSVSNLRRKCLSDDAVDRMLVELYGARDPPSGYDMSVLGEEGFAALEKIFRHINGQTKNITYAHNKVNFLVRVMPTELIGLDIILRAYMRTQNVQVATSAKNFLTLLQIKLDATLDRKKAYPIFTKYCIDTVHRMSAEAKEAPPQERKKIELAISRMLQLLQQFFLDICSPSAVTLPVATATNYYRTNMPPAKNAPFHLTVYWRREGVSLPANQKIVYIFKRGGVTLGSLRSRLAKDFKVPVQLVRLINSSRAILFCKQDDQLVEACGVSSFLDAVILQAAVDDTLNAKQFSPATTLAEDPDSDQMFPRKTLSNSKTHLSLIFELLSHVSTDVSQSAWNLLDLLPINTDMLIDMKTLGGAIDRSESSVEVSWEVLLSEGGILRQQYKLKIISELLAPLLNDYAAKDDVSAALRWKEAFVKLGGVRYLLQLAMEMNLDHSARGASVQAELEWVQKVQCLSSVLELLDHFWVCKSPAEDITASDIACQFGAYTHDAVVSKLLDIMFAISRDCGDEHDADIVSGLVPIQRLRSNSSVEECGPGSIQAKQRRKRSRAARFEQYFSSATKNTSTAVSMTESRNDLSLDGSDDAGSAGNVNHAAVAIKYTLSVATIICAKFPSALRVVQEFGELRRCLHTALLMVPDDDFRDTFCKGLLTLCTSSLSSGDVSLCSAVTSALLSFLPEVTHSHMATTAMDGIGLFMTEYFFALAELCRRSVTACTPVFTDADLTSLGDELCEFVLLYTRCEASEEEDEEDKLLQGVLLLLAAFLTVPRIDKDQQRLVKAQIGCERGLIMCIFNSYLFSVESGKAHLPAASLPRCKTPTSRQRAFAVLAELSNKCPENMRLLLELVHPHHSISAELPKASKKTTATTKSLTRYGRDMLIPKSRTGYCGLLNPGCICYMNSTLQQLFMIPAFRYGVLGADTGIAGLSDAKAADDILFQLQLLFAYLQESNKAYVDPTGFSAAFKDYEGQPTDVLVQQDASEFLSNFFQQIEGCIMGTKLESLLKDNFGGMFSNELLAEGGKRSERAEPFFMISVGVGQGKSTLEAALESFIEGETVDYTWESEVDGPNGKEVKKESLPTVKRVSVRSLPDHLIIHLKRFEFDFETMQQLKINEKFAFPLELDMFPYTVQGRQKRQRAGNGGAGVVGGSCCDASSDEGQTPHEDMMDDEDGYDYELAGVVVHVGTAHSGHYYSYIKERGGKNGAPSRRGASQTQPSSNQGASAAWFEFNDSFVSEFDVEDLEEECFGGVETWSGGGGAPGGGGKSFEKARNAFMLVYDKKKKTRGEEATSPVQMYPPTLVTDAILHDNDSFWRTKSIFNTTYYKFLNSLLMNPSYELGVDRDMDRKVVECAVRVAFGTLIQARERERVAKWCTWIMTHFIRRRPSCGYDLLQLLCSAEQTQKTQGDADSVSADTLVQLQLKSLLLDVDDADARNAVMRVILVAMEVVIHGPVSRCEGYAAGHTDSSSNLCLIFVSHIMSLCRVAQEKWHNLSVFFSPVAHLAEQSPEMKREMRSRRYMDTLLSVFLASDTPYPELVGGSEPANHKSRSMTDGYTHADCRSLLRAISALLRDDEGAGDGGAGLQEGSWVSNEGNGGEAVARKRDAKVSPSREAQTMLHAPVFAYR